MGICVSSSRELAWPRVGVNIANNASVSRVERTTSMLFHGHLWCHWYDDSFMYSFWFPSCKCDIVCVCVCVCLCVVLYYVLYCIYVSPLAEHRPARRSRGDGMLFINHNQCFWKSSLFHSQTLAYVGLMIWWRPPASRVRLCQVPWHCRYIPRAIGVH